MRLGWTVLLLALLYGPAGAAEDPAARPLPADSRVQQTLKLPGRMLAYSATAGSLPMRDSKGKLLGDIAFTAYMLDAKPAARRPVTFVFGGGPGSSVGWLHLRMAGPRILAIGPEGFIPGTAPVLIDNPDTWLDFTDLVFVDPIGTGFSRIAADTDEMRKAVWGWKQDIDILSRFIAHWLTKNGRMVSPKYLAGESYGGFRVPQVAFHLQTVEGVGVTGMVMISPVIDFSLRLSANSPIDAATRLPVMAAARIERDTKQDVAVDSLRAAERYAFGDYIQDLLQPAADLQALERVVEHVSALTGLDPALVRRMRGRIDSQTFMRELRRADGLIGSRYDMSVVAFDPYPEATEQLWEEPSNALVAPLTSAVTDYVTGALNWKIDQPYKLRDRSIAKRWDYPSGRVDASEDLRKALALDPKLRLLVAHGATDLVTPWMASHMILNLLPPLGDPARVQQRLYPGGHGFYERDRTRTAFRADVKALYPAE
jgi:carboxypeptidase C (cathepsin A)